MTRIARRLAPLVLLGGCVLITGPPLGDTDDDTEEPSACPVGTVTFTPDGGSSTDHSDVFAVGTAASPATWTIDSPGVLSFCPGTYYVALTVTADEASIEGDDPATTILSGGGVARIVDHQGAESVHLTRLTLRDGAASEGAAVRAEAGEIEAVDCVFTDNVASSRGGALMGVEIDVQGGLLKDNVAVNFGGAIWVAGELTLTDVRVEENEASDLVGGGIYAEGGPIVLTRVSLYENTARNSGGGLYASGATVTIVDSVFDANASQVNGGGMEIQGGSVSLTDTVFERNQGADGGAAHLSGASLVCTRTASSRGGFYNNNPGVRLIALSDATLTSDRCDWGEVTQDNTRYDLSMVSSGGGEEIYYYGDDASFSCTGLVCTDAE